VGIIWFSGAVVILARRFISRCFFALFQLRCRKVQDQQLLRGVQSLARSLKLSRRIRVVEASRLGSPIAFGILRPTIGLPLDFSERFEPSRQEAILLHEVAHLAGHDPFWCLLADAASALLWWLPALR